MSTKEACDFASQRPHPRTYASFVPWCAQWSTHVPRLDLVKPKYEWYIGRGPHNDFMLQPRQISMALYYTISERARLSVVLQAGTTVFLFGTAKTRKSRIFAYSISALRMGHGCVLMRPPLLYQPLNSRLRSTILG